MKPDVWLSFANEIASIRYAHAAHERTINETSVAGSLCACFNRNSSFETYTSSVFTFRNTW